MSLVLEDTEEYHLVTVFWPGCTNFQNAGSVDYRFVRGIRLVRTAETVNKVREAVIRSSTRPAGRQSVVLNPSDRRLRWILHYDFSFCPYKSKLHNDFWKRIRLPEWRFVGNSWPSWTRTLVFFRDILSVEAHFHLSGYVGKQTCRSWSDAQPCSVFEKLLNLVRSVGFWNYWTSFL